MNEKEAREPLTPTTRETAFYAGQKKGYLEAIDKIAEMEAYVRQQAKDGDFEAINIIRNWNENK